MEIIDFDNSKYPIKLKNISKPPKKLYTIGNIKLLNEIAISVIGSRCCSNYGISVANEFSKKLAVKGITIISGMAKGIDSVAHNACIDVGGNTIAVLGSGFNYIYPKENIKLFDKIISSNGLVISEYSENTKPDSSNFPKRNRIVSGLSIGTLVVEAAYRSGTSITAKIALSQGKKVFCIPNRINKIDGVGTNRLIQNGAKLVVTVDDILSEYDNLEKLQEIKSHKIESINKIRNVKIKSEYKEIYNIIQKEDCDVNTICKKTNMMITEINCLLTMMELEQIVELLPGNRVRIKQNLVDKF